MMGGMKERKGHGNSKGGRRGGRKNKRKENEERLGEVRARWK